MKASQRSLARTRTLHLVDAENAVGHARVTEDEMRALSLRYSILTGIGACDQVVIACAHNSALAVGYGWPDKRYLMRSGRNGADIRLAEVIVEERLHERFDHIYVCSGDGDLAPFVADLVGRNVRVTVVSKRSSISHAMRQAASDIVYLDGPLATATIEAAFTLAA